MHITCTLEIVHSCVQCTKTANIKLPSEKPDVMERGFTVNTITQKQKPFWLMGFFYLKRLVFLVPFKFSKRNKKSTTLKICNMYLNNLAVCLWSRRSRSFALISKRIKKTNV